MNRKIALAAALLAWYATGALEAARFVVPPSVEKAGTDWVVGFKVDEPCVVTVWVSDEDGRVVRHLAAGMLGKNAPKPFQKGSLEQRLRWDGCDDAGRPVRGKWKVHVALGLRAEFEREVLRYPQGVASRGPVGIACDGNGNLYVAEGTLWVSRVTEGVWTAGVTTLVTIKVFGRDGSYLKTIVPFNPVLSPDDVNVISFLTTAEGRRIPLSRQHGHRPYAGFLPGMPGMRRHTPVITRDGRYIYVCGRMLKGKRRLLCIGLDGSARKDSFYGPILPDDALVTDTFIAVDPEGTRVYVSGLRGGNGKLIHAVYTARWRSDEVMKPFAGKPYEAGDDASHFNDPRGLAVDASGRVWVCDYMNDRVQVFSRGGRLLKSLPVRGPEQVLVSPRGGVYVLSVKDRGAVARYGKEVVWEVYAKKSLVKFSGLDDWKRLYSLRLPERPRHMHDAAPILCLDTSGKNMIVWIANAGRQDPDDFLWKVVDDGKVLRKVPHGIRRLNRRSEVSPFVAGVEALGAFYLTYDGSVWIVDAHTGKMKRTPVKIDGRIGGMEAGFDGSIYLNVGRPVDTVKLYGEKRHAEMRWYIRRYSPEGKLIGFGRKKEIETLGHHLGTFFGEKPSQFAVAPDGKVYVVEFVAPKGPYCVVNVYDLDGTLFKKHFIRQMTRTAGDITIGGGGEIYVADALKPIMPGVVRKREFPPFMGKDPRLHFKIWYGIVCRFGPGGGALRALPKGEKMKATHWGYHNAPSVVEGALWEYYGISPMTQAAGCECVVARMDADGWGRVFFPDVPSYSVRVLDSAGNLLLRFGDYGNCDSRGEGGYIPLLFPELVAACNDRVLVVDRYNRRVLMVRLVHDEEKVAAR